MVQISTATPPILPMCAIGEVSLTKLGFAIDWGFHAPCEDLFKFIIV